MVSPAPWMTSLPRTRVGLGDGDGLADGRGVVVGEMTDGVDRGSGALAFDPSSATKMRTSKAAASVTTSPTTRSAVGKGRGERDCRVGFMPLGSLTVRSSGVSGRSRVHQCPGSFYVLFDLTGKVYRGSESNLVPQPVPKLDRHGPPAELSIEVEQIGL